MHRKQTADRINLLKMVPVPSAPSDYTLQKNVVFNGKIYSYIQNFNLLTDAEHEELKNENWFKPGLPRDISLEILLQMHPGSFLVRQSESLKGCFALSLRAPNQNDLPKLCHYLIEKSIDGYRFKGYHKDFPTLKSLVVHHSIIRGHLPVTLLLTRAQDFAIRSLIVEQIPARDDIECENDENEDEDDDDDDKSVKTTSCFCKK
jgi:hypothetical protein